MTGPNRITVDVSHFRPSPSNASVSREMSTQSLAQSQPPAANPHDPQHRSRTDTSGASTEPPSLPQPAATATQSAQHDRFADLTALVIEPRDRRNPQPFERIIANQVADDNPTIAEMLELKPR